MSAKSECAVFAQIFADIQNVACEHVGSPEALEACAAIAKLIWQQTDDIDFHPRDMGVDKELIRLGLAKMGPNPDREKYLTEPAETALYLGLDYKDRT